MKKLFMKLPVILVIAAILFFGVVFLSTKFDKGKETILTTATLEKTMDVAELSGAQFTYNGIAEIYKKKDKKDVKCHVLYNAKVKAGIDMTEVEFKLDDENKKVLVTLPEVVINKVNVDEKKLDFIPENTTVEVGEVLTACKNDAKKEANDSEQLLTLAEENIKSIVEALIYPVIDNYGYEIAWQ